MFGKLIKYECKSMGRLLFPLFGITLVMSIFSGLGMKNIEFLNSLYFIKTLVYILTALFAIINLVTLASPFAVSVYRFKTNLFGNEGYIMHTLPITAIQHISAKLIVSVIFELLAIIFVGISTALFSLIMTYFNAWSIFREIYGNVMMCINSEFLAAFAELLVLGIMSFVCFNTAVYAAIAIGHSATEHKVIKSVGAYVLINALTQFISGTIIVPLEVKIDMAGISSLSIFNTVLLLGILSTVIYSTIYIAVTNYFMTKKLNLQ